MPSVNNRIEPLLASEDETSQLEGLQMLGAECDEPPSPKVANRAIALLREGSASLKEAAGFSVCLHWAIPEALPIVMNIVEGRTDDAGVLAIAAEAVPRYVSCKGFDAQKALRILSLMVMDERLDDDVRGAAYVSMLEVGGRISSKAELAKMPLNLSDMLVDWDWVKKLGS